MDSTDASCVNAVVNDVGCEFGVPARTPLKLVAGAGLGDAANNKDTSWGRREATVGLLLGVD